jgi:hypothetical protein
MNCLSFENIFGPTGLFSTNMPDLIVILAMALEIVKGYLFVQEGLKNF